MGWHSSGKDALKKAEKDDKEREDARNKVYRLWVPGGAELNATFLDPLEHNGIETPFMFDEHNVYLNGHWRNWFTCIEGEPHPETGKPQKCPLCAIGNSSYFAAAFSIVDHSQWESKKTKKVHEHELKVVVCKSQVRKILLKKMKKEKGLRGWLVEISRTDGDSPNTGDVFDFESKFKNDKAFDKYTGGAWKKLPEVPDYLKVFAPKTQEELEAILAGKNTGPAGYNDDVDADDDVVQF